MATKNVNVRIPEELHALIKVSAETDRRSLNSQIIHLIEVGLNTRKKRK